MEASETFRSIGPESSSAIGFMEKGTGQHQSNTVYRTDAPSPCLNAVNYKEPVKILEIKEIGEDE